jgi:hypothetical protein
MKINDFGFRLGLGQRSADRDKGAPEEHSWAGRLWTTGFETVLFGGRPGVTGGDDERRGAEEVASPEIHGRPNAAASRSKQHSQGLLVVAERNRSLRRDPYARISHERRSSTAPMSAASRSS